MLLISTSMQPHCSAYCCLSCPNSMGFDSLTSINTEGRGWGWHWNKRLYYPSLLHTIFYILKPWQLYNLSQTPRKRTLENGAPWAQHCKEQASLNQERQLREETNHLLPKQEAMFGQLVKVFPYLPPVPPSSSVLLYMFPIINIISFQNKKVQ